VSGPSGGRKTDVGGSGAGGLGFLAVLLDVMLCCFRRMVRRVMQMALGRVRMMSRRFVMALLVVPCGLAMMPGGVLMMFSGASMMFGCLLGHGSSFG